MRFTLLIFIIFLCSTKSFAADPLPCPDISLLNKYEALKDPKISQNAFGVDSNTCYAGSAARLLEAELADRGQLAAGETVSWVSLAAQDKVHSFFHKNDFGVGDSCDLIEKVTKAGICIQKNNSADRTLDPSQIQQLRNEFDRYSSAEYNFLRQEENRIEPSQAHQNLENKYASEFQCISGGQIALSSIKKAMDTLFSSEFIKNLVDENCTRVVKLPNVKCDSVTSNSDVLKSSEKIAAFIIADLQSPNPKPVTLGYCPQGRDGNKCLGYGHSMTVVGSRPSKRIDGAPSCELQLINTYGADCDDQYPDLIKCNKGVYWIDLTAMTILSTSAGVLTTK